MKPTRRPYTAPELRSEPLQLGIYGDYGDETGAFQPLNSPDLAGKIGMD
jgi:hypothetical protein